MADITYGSAQEVESGWTIFCEVCQLDTNKFVVVYGDKDDGFAGKARVGTVSGTTITWGNIVEFCSDIGATTQQLDVCKLDTDKFVVVYEDFADSDKGKVVLGNVATRTITFETPVEFSGENDAEYPSCCALSATKFAIVYNDETSGDVGTCVICSVANNTITPDTGNALAFEGHIADTRCCKLDTDKLVAVYVDIGDNDYAKACAFTVSTTTPTAGAIKGIDAVTVYETNCAQLDTDKFIMTWEDDDTPKGIVEICTVSDTTITEGTPVDFNAGYTYKPAIVPIGAANFVIVYSDGGNSGKGTSRYCSYSGTTITLDGEEIFSNAETVDTDIAAIDALKIVVAYRDDADPSKHGEAIIGDISAPPTANPYIPHCGPRKKRVEFFPTLRLGS